MPPDLFPFPATLLERLARLDMDVGAVLRRANLPQSRFRGERPQGTTAELFALWNAIEASGMGDDFGLRLGADVPPDLRTLASLAALHSATLGEGLQKLARYKRLVCPEQITLHVAHGEARLRFEWLLAECHPPALLIDAVFAGVVALAHRGSGAAVHPRRVELTRRRSRESLLEAHFHCKVRFDAPADAIVFDERALATPFITHNAQLLSVLVPGLEVALAKEGARRSLVDDVRTALCESICGERPNVQKVARSLGMSARTLQRRLGDLGTSYRTLLDDVRRRSARRLLSQTDLAAGEVAFLLGFEELNSFTRAFHAWEGTSPSKWRSAAR